MVDTAAITPVIFQDPGVPGLGRVSAATRKTSLNRIRRRRLDCYALVYLIQGSGRFADEYGARRRLTAGDAFLLFPRISHSYGPEPGDAWEEIYILFEGPLFDLWQQQNVIQPRRPLYRLEPLSYWTGKITAVWQEKRPALSRMIGMQELLADMNQTREQEGISHHQRDWLSKAQSLLAEYAAEPGAAQRAAMEMGTSYQTFRKTFSRLNGQGPAAYCMGQRVQAAARRLLTETTPIKRIAEELGFSDEFHFSRRFKECTGISPGAYRRRMMPSG